VSKEEVAAGRKGSGGAWGSASWNAGLRGCATHTHTHTCGTQVVLSYNVRRLYAPPHTHTHIRTYPPALTCNHKAPLPLSPPDLV
jgi:hypothetical protein